MECVGGSFKCTSRILDEIKEHIIDKGAILSKFKCLQHTEIEKVSFHYWLKKKMHAQSKINPLKLTSHKAKLSYWHQNILSSSVLVL